MKKILYVSNIEVPYRTEYFNQLSKKVDLTVLYERKKSSNRNEKWSTSIESNYSIEYLKGIKILNEYALDLKIIKYLFSKKYDEIIIGCYNSPSQIIGMLLMRIFKRKYILNLDGDYYIEGTGIKKSIKRYLIKGATKYFVAGQEVKSKLIKYVNKDNIFCYHFSSMTNKEITENSKHLNKNISNEILVVGQYFDYKGLDIALEAAKINSKIKYKFVGSGNRSNLLLKKINEMKLKNVKVIPFLQKKELFEEYQKCKCVLLSSNKECWGLVINEAASFGCPIISTNGSGAANEFLDSNWIVPVGDYRKMYSKILELDNKEYDVNHLIEKSKKYTIEQTVIETIKMLEE